MFNELEIHQNPHHNEVNTFELHVGYLWEGGLRDVFYYKDKETLLRHCNFLYNCMIQGTNTSGTYAEVPGYEEFGQDKENLVDYVVNTMQMFWIDDKGVPYGVTLKHVY